MSEENQVLIGDEMVDLAELAGVDMSELQEVRSMVLPAGQMLFKVLDAKLESKEVADRRDEAEAGATIKKPVVAFELEVMDCTALVKDDVDPASVVGRKHFHTYWITDVKTDLGRVKAFLVDIGVNAAGGLTDLLAEAHGMEFVSDVTNTKDKNDPDRVYANLKNTMTIADWQTKQSAE